MGQGTLGWARLTSREKTQEFGFEYVKFEIPIRPPRKDTIGIGYWVWMFGRHWGPPKHLGVLDI